MNRSLAGITAAALSLVLGACGDAGDTDRQTAGQKLADAYSPAAQAAPPAQSTRAFANGIAADGAYELAAARLAQQMGRSETVKAFAAEMTQDHTVAANELRDALTRTSGVAADPQLSAAQRQSLEGLRNAGKDFDNDYARQEIAAHTQELSALRDYADNGMEPALSEFAANAENMAADHLSLARKLS
jgi:putative membrane protein